MCLHCVNSKSEVTGFTSKPDVTFLDVNMYQNPVATFSRAQTRMHESGIFSKPLAIGSNSWKLWRVLSTNECRVSSSLNANTAMLDSP